MPLNVAGLKPLDTIGLDRLNTGGLTPLDTSGLTQITEAPAITKPIDEDVWKNFQRIDDGLAYRPNTSAAGPGGTVTVTDPLESLYEDYKAGNSESRQKIRQEWTSTADTEPPGRLRSISNAIARGFGGTFAAIPKSLALMGSEDPQVWRNLQRIDEGKPYIPKLVFAGGRSAMPLKDPLAPFYEDYKAASAEERQKVREAWTANAEKARKSTLYEAGNAVDKYIADNFPVNPELQDEFWSSKVPQGLGSALAFVSVALLTRSAVGTSTAATFGAPAALGSALNRADQFEQAIDSGADVATALEAAQLGAVIGTTEAVPIGNLLNRLDRVSGGSVKRYLLRAIQQGSEEAVQEAFAGILNEAVAQKLYDPERGIWTAERLEEGAVGFTTGALLESLFTLILPGRRRGSSRDGADETADDTSTIEEVDAFTADRLRSFEELESLNDAQLTERQFLLDNQDSPSVVAAAYGVELQPVGEREQARVDTPALSDEDIASPLPDDLIQEGRADLQDALGQQRAEEILDQADFPPIGSQIQVSGQAVTVLDAYEQDGIPGVKLQYEDGRVIAESFESLRGRVRPVENEDVQQTDEAPRGQTTATAAQAPDGQETLKDAETQARPVEQTRPILTPPVVDVVGREKLLEAEARTVPRETNATTVPLDIEGLTAVADIVPPSEDIAVQAISLIEEPKSANDRLSDFLEKAAQRFAMEAQGQATLDDMEAENVSPQSVSGRFWSDTYFKLNAKTQVKFQRMLKGLGFKPGDIGSVESDGTKNVLGDWVSVGKFLEEDLPSEAQYLEGTERGYVALMQWANQQATQASAETKSIQTKAVAVPIEKSLTEGIVKQPVERQADTRETGTLELRRAKKRSGVLQSLLDCVSS